MKTIFYFKFVRLASLLSLAGFVLAASQTAHANSFDLASLQKLTPRLEQASQLLSRRFGHVLSRHQSSLRKAAARCEAGERGACRLQAWQGFLGDIANDGQDEQIYRVHRYVNNFRYRTDLRNWKRSDYWAVPEQLFARGGDCEDYAIAKYVSLRALGMPADRMRIIVLYDRKKRIDHAILAVLGPGEPVILDNNYKRVISWEDTRDRYKLYYSLNEDSIWIHGTKT